MKFTTIAAIATTIISSVSAIEINSDATTLATVVTKTQSISLDEPTETIGVGNIDEVLEDQKESPTSLDFLSEDGQILAIFPIYNNDNSSEISELIKDIYEATIGDLQQEESNLAKRDAKDSKWSKWHRNIGVY